MSVRPASPEDAGALAFLHAAAFAAPWAAAWSAEDFTGWLSRPQAMAVIADPAATPLAFGLALAAGEEAELLSIGTAPGSRGRGWGRHILQALDQEAAHRGLKRWILEVARNNMPAQALYASEGFVEIGVRPGYYATPEGRIDAAVMSRPVGRAGGHGRA
jgi:ribosomal protein S18 acetylase RimI-like enzyme